jgi:hypothetical protein
MTSILTSSNLPSVFTKSASHFPLFKIVTLFNSVFSPVSLLIRSFSLSHSTLSFMNLHFFSSLFLSLSSNFLFDFNLFFSLCLMLSTFPSSFLIVLRCRDPEPEFVNLLRSPGINPSLAGQYDNPIGCTGPPGYIGRLNRFLGIDSWAP